jgi:type I restriction enzyme S subunit
MRPIHKQLLESLSIWSASDGKKPSGRGRASYDLDKVYGISKLRLLITRLALGGALCDQLIHDEPSDLLVERIRSLKFELSGEGKKKSTEDDLITLSKESALPVGWSLVRLGDIVISQAGFAFNSNGFNENGRGMPLIRIRDVGQAFTGTYYEGEYRQEFIVHKGDYLISMDGEFRVAKSELDSALLNQRVSRLIFFGDEISKEFIALALQVQLTKLQGTKSYTTVDHLSGRQISNAIIALPPQDEQRRIMEKFAKLTILCDELEGRHAKSLTFHKVMSKNFLDELIASIGTSKNKECWRKISTSFEILFGTQNSIQELKRTLLELALMGRLAPQRDDEDSAMQLLKEIDNEKYRLVSAGLMKKGKPLPIISENEKIFPLPRGWEWARLQTVIDVRDGTHDSPKESIDINSFPLVTSKDFSGGGINFGEAKRISAADHEEIAKRSFVEKFDILFSMIGGNIGNQVMVTTDQPFSIKNVALFKYYNRELTNPFFIKKYSEYLASKLQSSAVGGAQPFVSLGQLRSLVIALPPKQEQRRIVEKLDQLLLLCDKLEKYLKEANQLKKKIADALVEQALV